MPRIYSIDIKVLRLRNYIIWSLSEEGHTGADLASLFNMDKSWINRIIKDKPKNFESILVPVPESVVE